MWGEQPNSLTNSYTWGELRCGMWEEETNELTHLYTWGELGV